MPVVPVLHHEDVLVTFRLRARGTRALLRANQVVVIPEAVLVQSQPQRQVVLLRPAVSKKYAIRISVFTFCFTALHFSGTAADD